MTPAAAGISVKTPQERGATSVPAAPDNVFVYPKAGLSSRESHKWINYYELPVEYTVEIHNGILSIENPALATRFMPAGLKRRFCVIDDRVEALYGDQIRHYFATHSVSLTTLVIKGEEENKLFSAVEKILDALCEFGLLRREPVVAIGGGCVLDIVGFAASCYRRGVPYIRVPTTLLAIVDASVGVKCGVDWHHPTMGGLKNRVGAFYPPIAAFLDKAFIATQDDRNVINGMGEIIKLALVRSAELFALLENHGRRLVRERFQNPDGVADRVIELSIQIMLEELGPNLWEYHLERCVDYGHTFSKLLEMHSQPAIMHGEAVNIDGFLCVILSHRFNWISTSDRNRVLSVMRDIGLPTWHRACTLKLLAKSVEDGTEHRHGKLRMPLVRGAIGQYDFVNQISRDDLSAVIQEALSLHPGAQVNDDTHLH